MCPADAHPIAVAAADHGEGSEAPDPAMVEDLVAANHILFDQGVVDAFGHVSVRHDKRPDRFLLARNMAPGSVGAGDIVEFDLDGNPVNAKGRKVYLERFIHGELYRSRPDVMAVVHSHSHSIVPLSVVKGAKLRALFHMAGFIGQDAPVFEIRDAGGDGTDLLISSNDLGRALADKFGGADIVLMRGLAGPVIRLVAEAETVVGAGWNSLFTQGRAAGTVLLWLIMFMGFGTTTVIVLLSPTLFKSSGLSLSTAALLVGLNNFVGVAGMASAGRLVERFGPLVLVPAFGLGAATLAVMGSVASSAGHTDLGRERVGRLAPLA